ncbi:hypothetical protein FRC12_012333 [Ceratobasidium sp. 428]|nr:hypothetical protein FRC09_009560 [Ceratobasidium sp. 395]KAG8795594.1 hypothetical protein FRC12_012333 [Ceratobasidium sp. 428]
MHANVQLGPDGSFHSLMVPDQGKTFMLSSGARGGGMMVAGQCIDENPGLMRGRGIAVFNSTGGGFQITLKDSHGQESVKVLCDESPMQPSGQTEGFWVEN